MYWIAHLFDNSAPEQHNWGFTRLVVACKSNTNLICSALIC